VKISMKFSRQENFMKFSITIAGTHCAHPRRDGQVEFTWVAGYIPRLFTRRETVTHPSINGAGPTAG